MAVSNSIRIFFEKKNSIEIKKIDKVKHKKLLSIVIPSYCRTKKKIQFLDFAISKIYENIKKLSDFDYEIILFDNCSINSLSFLKDKYKDLNIIYKKSSILLEPHDSWRSAANFSSGKYIFFHSDDDFIYESFFNEFIDLTNQKEYPDLFYWKSKNVNDELYEAADFLWYWNWPRRDTGYFKIKTGFIKHPMPSSSWILKREFYENHGVTPSIADGIDLDLSFRITKFIKEGYFLSNTISAYRHHSDQGTKIDDPQLLDSYFWFINKGAIIYRYYTGIKALYYCYLYILYYAFLHALKGRLVEDLHNQDEFMKIKIHEFLFGRFLTKYVLNVTKNYLYFFDKEFFFMFLDTFKGRPDYLINRVSVHLKSFFFKKL